jgi:hypothetical protein
MNSTRHEDFYELRFLLHGVRERYDSEEILYIPSQVNSVWEKVARKVLESWRTVPSALAERVPGYLWSKLHIQEIAPRSIIAELSPDSITGDDLPSTQEREELLGQISLDPNRQELWKRLALHEALDGRLVPIDSQTYLENPEFLLDRNLQGIVTLIKRSSNLRQDWIPLWTLQAAIDFALNQQHPEHFCSMLLDLAPQVSKELLPKLKQTKWLPLRSGGVISPENVILLPKHLLETLGRDLEQVFRTEESDYASLSMLKSEVHYPDALKNVCSTWYENNILCFLLENTTQPSTHSQFVLNTLKTLLNNNQTISNDNIERLKKKSWLTDRNGRAVSLQPIRFG